MPLKFTRFREWIVFVFCGGVIRFFVGTEYQQSVRLQVDTDTLPSLIAERDAIQVGVSKAESEGRIYDAAALQSRVSILNHRISQVSD